MDQSVTLVDGDITKLEALPEADFTIDAAASTNVADYQRDPEAQCSLIAAAAENLCALVRAARTPTKLLYVSSGAAYGSTLGLSRPIRESDTVLPYGPDDGYKAVYGRGKQIAEHHLRNLAAEGFNVSIARAFSFVGRYLPTDQHYAISDFMEAARSGEPVRITSTRPVVRSYLHADDLAKALITYVFAADSRGLTVNLGSGDAINLHDLARMIAEAFNVSVETSGVSDSPADWYVPDMTLAHEHLGFSPRINISKAIEESVGRR
jgi:dTDP-glucose 4,6-dehydratase